MERFDNFPPPGYQDAWIAWFTAHGINPEAVPVEDGWVERDEQTRQVRHVAFVGDRARNDGHGRVLLEERTVQLESAPLPFPVAA